MDDKLNEKKPELKPMIYNSLFGQILQDEGGT